MPKLYVGNDTFTNNLQTRWPVTILIKITDQMALSTIPEIQTLRRTINKWHHEILNYFENKLTNGRTEGFKRVGKLIQRNMPMVLGILKTIGAD